MQAPQPPHLGTFVERVIRWRNRVLAYAAILETDRYPLFRLWCASLPDPTTVGVIV